MSNIRTILSANEKRERLNILVVGATHERYEQQLCLTGHKFYSYNDQVKVWNNQYGAKPDNYITLDSIPTYIRPDVVLTHVSGQRLEMANDIGAHFGIKVIRHTHTLPESLLEQENFHKQTADFNTFISEFSRKAWNSEGEVIPHGLDTEFWCPINCERDDSILSVVNYIASRDWACGNTIYEQIKKLYKDGYFKIVGNNPGLSLPAGPNALKTLYSNCGIFLNTSQFSPIPMSLLEAMACGIAVISTSTCEIPNIIEHGKNGLLAKTPEEFIECMKKLKNNEALTRTLGDNARKTILESFNIKNFIENWNSILYRAITK